MNLSRDPIEVIFFDAAGTLFRVRGSVGAIYSEVARRHGIDAAPDELQRAFIAAFTAKSGQGLSIDGTADPVRAERHWWLEVVQQVFAGRMPAEVLPDYFNDVFEVFRGAVAWELFSDSRPGLEDLRARGYRLGVISNFDSRLYDVLADLGIASLFEQVILSWRAGVAKPDAGIFQRALRSMQVSSARALHVGDSPEEDINGARAAGLQAILLDRRGIYVSWTEGRRVRSMAELCNLLP